MFRRLRRRVLALAVIGAALSFVVLSFGAGIEPAGAATGPSSGPGFGPGNPVWIANGAHFSPLNYDSDNGQAMLAAITGYETAATVAYDSATDPYSDIPLTTLGVDPTTVVMCPDGGLIFEATEGFNGVADGAPVRVAINVWAPPTVPGASTGAATLLSGAVASLQAMTRLFHP